MTDQQDYLQQLLQVTKELAEYKAYLSEAQDELQQLQAQFVTTKRTAAATAAAANDLRLQLHQAQELNTRLQEDSSLTAGAQQQQQLQLAETKQQLAMAKELSAAKQLQVQELLQQLEVQEQQHKQQELVALEQLAVVKGQAAAAKAEVRELRRAEAAASQQLSAVAADLEAARAAEKAALADARRARSAEASRSKQLAETEEQLGKCREQLALAGDIHSQMSRLQSALQEHKRQQRSSQADAEHSKEQQTALLAELSQYRMMLTEAQEEVARLEADSRELQALRRRSSSSSISLQPSSTGASMSGYTVLHNSGANASILADTGVSHGMRCAGGTLPQQQQGQSMTDVFVDQAGYATAAAAAAAAAPSSSLVTQLSIPDVPGRPNSAQVTQGQSAAAAEAEVHVDLCPTSSTTPTATGAAAASSPKLGWLASPKLSPRMSPRLGSNSSSSTGCTAGPSASSSSRIPAAPLCGQQSKEGGNISQHAAGPATASTGHATRLMSATAPAGLLGRCCIVSSSGPEQHLKSHSCSSRSFGAAHPSGAGSQSRRNSGNLKSAAAAAAATAGSAVQSVEGACLLCHHSSNTSSTAGSLQRKASSTMGAAAREAACPGMVSADNTPRQRNSTSGTVAVPVPLACALLSPRCLWTSGTVAGAAAAAVHVPGPKAEVAPAQQQV